MSHPSRAHLHDEKVRVVDVEGDGLKHVRNLVRLHRVAIDLVLVAPAEDDLR